MKTRQREKVIIHAGVLQNGEDGMTLRVGTPMIGISRVERTSEDLTSSSCDSGCESSLREAPEAGRNNDNQDGGTEISPDHIPFSTRQPIFMAKTVHEKSLLVRPQFKPNIGIHNFVKH